MSMGSAAVRVCVRFKEYLKLKEGGGVDGCVEVVMLNACHKMQDKMFLYVLRKSSKLNKLYKALGSAGKCIVTKLKTQQ